MNIQLIILYAAAVALTLGVAADCYTTYVGIFVKKIAKEMNPSWFTKSPLHLALQVAVAASTIALAYLAQRTSIPVWVELPVAGLWGYIAYKRGLVGLKNWRLNRGGK